MFLHIFIWIVAVFILLTSRWYNTFGAFTFTVAIISGTLISWVVSLIFSDVIGFILALVVSIYALKEIMHE